MDIDCLWRDALGVTNFFDEKLHSYNAKELGWLQLNWMNKLSISKYYSILRIAVHYLANAIPWALKNVNP